MRIHGILFLIALLATPALHAAGEKAVTSIEEAGPDYKIQGEYEGTVSGDQKIGIHVIALGKGKFDAVVYTGGLPGAGWNTKDKQKASGETSDSGATFKGEGITGQISRESFAGEIGGKGFEAKRVERKSPTLGARPPEGAVVLFDGSGVDNWEGGKLVEDKYLGVGTRSKQKFGNFTLHLEFRTPWMPESRGQSRGNSGMYLLDQYECQVLDSFGLEGVDNECGGIYKASRPAVNMCLPPLQWQTYDVDFTAAKFDDSGNRTEQASVTIRHNGVVIHENLKLPGATPGGKQNDEKPGALFLQNHGDPVVFGNIWVVEK